MSAIHCLSSDELRNFVLGQTDDARSEEILGHLSECQACEDTVASLDDTADSLVVSVRQAVEPGDAADSQAGEAADPLAAALASVRSRFAPSVETPPLDGTMSRIVERVRDYELVDELGSGGMGTVYKAVHTKLDRTVALKLLPARRLRDRGAVSRFEREMKAIGRLDHPAIVRATDAGEVDGTHFLAMDFVDGIDLGKLVRLTGPLDIPSACELIRQAAIGLQYAHDQGLIHRDVKPSNLMVEKGRGLRAESREADASGDLLSGSGLSTLDSQLPTVRILDLGLALFGSASEAVDELTTVGQLMGTLDYMAPEQADNSHSVDARADVYSLGATLFKLLAGAAPYETAERCSPLQKMKALATTDPPAIASRRDDLPAELAAIVDRTLLREPDERFQSAAEVAEALAPFCDGQAINDLVERGVQLAELKREVELRQFQSGHLAPRAQSPDASVLSGQHVSRGNVASGGNGDSGTLQPAVQKGSSHATKWLIWTAFTLLAAITIWIQTDTGTLKIECADKDVPIEIRNSSGEVVKRETLSVGPNEIVIHSGSYEIILPKEYDELKVENDKYELTRGGEWIARVTKQARGVSETGSALRAESPAAIDGSSGNVVIVNQTERSMESHGAAAGQTEGEAAVPSGFGQRFELEKIVWEIDQKAIREGVTGAPTLNPRSALEILDPIVSGDFKYPHEQYRDQPLPQFVLYRTREKTLLPILYAPPLNQCVRKVNAGSAKSQHDRDPGAENGVYSNVSGSSVTQEGTRYSHQIAPSLNAAGQMTLTLEFERSLRIGEPGAENRTRRETFTVDPLRVDETLIVLEVDAEADKVWLFEIRPGQNGRNLLVPSDSHANPSITRGIPSEVREPSTRSQTQLVFSGRAFEQWRESVLTERNPEELKNAVMALCILGRQNRDREAAETVLKVTDAYPCEVGSSPEGELIAASIRYLRTLDAEAIVPAVVEALTSRGTNTRRLIVEHLASGTMYSGVATPGGVAIPSTGKAEPLSSRLKMSSEYRKALVELFPELGHDDLETSTLRYVAFQQIEGFLDDAALEAEIDGLLEDIFRKRDSVRLSNTTPGQYSPRAILHLTRRSPRPELATYFLDNLERTNPNLPDDVSVAWLPSYSSDWYGLWLLGNKAEGESDRIAKLLTAKLPGTLHPSPVQATTVPTTPAGWGDTSSPRQSVTRKLLALDLLATIGPGAKSALPAVIDEIEALTGQRPVDDGEYGYEANDPRTFFVQYKAPFGHGLTGDSQASGGFFGGGGGFGGGGVPGTGGGFFSVSDVGPEVRNREPIVIPEPWLRLNAALRALKSLTGKTPLFEKFPLSLKQPEPSAAGGLGAGMPAGGYGGGGDPGLGLAGGGGGEGYGDYGTAGMNAAGPGMSDGEFVGQNWRPKLVSYRGKGFGEWAATELASASATELNDVRRAIELLGNFELQETNGAVFARIFEAAMNQRGKITDADRRVLHQSFRNGWFSFDGPTRGSLLQAIFEGTPTRTALVLAEIVAPSLGLTKSQSTTDLSSEPPEPFNIEWAAPNEITRDLIYAVPFGSRYQNLVDDWDKHGPELRAAILHVEAQLPALKQVNRTDLLQKLIDGGSPKEKLAAALIVARIDLSKQKDAPPRARNRNKAFAETPPLQLHLKQAAIEALVNVIRERPKGVDWMNAVPALVSLSRGRLDEELASEIIKLILADSTLAESVNPFSLRVNQPEDPFTAGSGGMFGEMGSGLGAAGGEGGPLGMGSGSAAGGMSGGLPGFGFPGGGDSGSSGYPGGLTGMEGGSFAGMTEDASLDPVVLTLSRRFLLCELLAIAPPSDEKLRDRIASQLSKLLRKPGALDGVKQWSTSTLDVLTNYWRRGASFRGTMQGDLKSESQEFARAAIRAVAALVSPERFHELLDLKTGLDETKSSTPQGTQPDKRPPDEKVE